MTNFFWKNWTSEYRYAWYVTGGAFIIAVLFMWHSYLRGNDAVIHWQKLQEQKSVESIEHTFSVGPFELSVPAENFVIYEYFNGSDLEPNKIAPVIYLVLLGVSLVILLTIMSTLDRFWFIVGMVLFILFLYSLRLKVLAIFGQINHIPLISFSLLLTGLCVYFNMIRMETGFRTRALIFAAVITTLVLMIFFFSGVKYPFLHLYVTSYPAAFILVLLFILLVSHEIVASFIYILSRNTSGGSGNSKHFALIVAIYFANLTLTVLHEIGSLDWNFIYFNLYLLLTISAIIGLWGFRDREPMYQNIFPFLPYGAFFFVALGTICFATIGALLGNMNDAALKVVRDIIIFSHIGFGLIFVTYILSNFLSMLGQNLPVYKVLYNPNRMPYFTFQFAGLIVTLAFVFYGGWQNYIYNGVAGFYNNLGDLDMILENPSLARAHYDQASSYGFQNHHANYALARLKMNTFNFQESQRHFGLANDKRPSEYSLANAGNLYIWQSENFDAIKAFRHADKVMGGSGIIRNNLGFAFSKVYQIDSAVFYLNKAREESISKPTAETNFFALITLQNLPVKADSIINTFGSVYSASQANALALANVQKQKFNPAINPLAVKRLNLHSATLLNNYLVHKLHTIDSAEIDQAYLIADDSVNSDYREVLKVQLATAYYFKNNVSRALQIMAELAFISEMYKGKYNYLMGLWALEQGNPELASSYFRFAVMQNYKEAKLYNAIALTEAGEINEALIAWDTVAQSKDQDEQTMAAQIKKILTVNSSELSSLADQEKYLFCRYRLGVYDTELFDHIISTLQDNNYKAQALLDMARRQFDWDNLNAAIEYFNQVGGLPLTDQNLYNKIRHFELLMLSERKELQKIAQLINEGIEFSPKQELEKRLYTALINETTDTVRAEQNFKILSTYNPYFEEGIIATAAFYRNKDKTSLKPYNILAEAVQVNDNSIKLWNAYIGEALRMGFDEYAVSALQRVEELKNKARGSRYEGRGS